MTAFWHRVKKEKAAYFFIAPLLILMGVFLFVPVFESVRLSFYDASLRTETFIGLENYRNLMDDPIFWLELKNTFIIASFLILFNIGFSLLVAVIIANLSKRSQSFYRAAFYLPALSSGILMSMVWLWIFNPTYGFLNYLLSLFGIKPVIWLGEPNLARLAVAFLVFTWITGKGIILYLAAIMGIPKTIYDAAEIDGAGALQKFFRITIPLIMPTTLYLLVITTIGGFQIWAAIFLLTGGGPAYQTMTFVFRVYQLGFLYFDIGTACTHATILMIMVFLISFFQFRILRKELEF